MYTPHNRKGSFVSYNGIENTNRVKEVFQYTELVLLLVKRDFVAMYRQTVFGPFWFLFQPLSTTLVYYLVFHKIVNVTTQVIPIVLFYFSGVSCWNLFSDVLLKTADTFILNAGIFGKVYFPRLIIPISVLISCSIRFLIQFIVFIGFWLFFVLSKEVIPNWNLLFLFPIIVVFVALLGSAIGLIFSALTVLRRDLRFLLAFGVQLLMFASAIVYPLELVQLSIKKFFAFNPFVGFLEMLRYIFFGTSSLPITEFLYALVITTILVLLSIKIFLYREKDFIDVI